MGLCSKVLSDQLQLVAWLLESYLGEFATTGGLSDLPDLVGFVLPHHDDFAADLLGN